MPRIRSQPEDFRVEEVPLFSPQGEGEHTYLWVEKRQLTTEEVARALAKLAGVPGKEVGFAGRKDRRAVTRQWFSVPRLDPARALALDLAGVRVLGAELHPHKLRTAQLRGNRFEIVVQDVGREAGLAAQERLQGFAQTGFPNRFGKQRFGRDGRNAELGAALLGGSRPNVDRRQARFLLSALQSAVFNQVLEKRAVPIEQVVLGDVAVVHSSGGLFRVEDEAQEAKRAAHFEISATGPIFGSKMMRPVGETLALEEAVAEHFQVSLWGDLSLPRGLRLRGGRRPLRVRPEGVECRFLEQRLEVEFFLPAGSYATVLLQEMFAHQELTDGPE